MMLSFKQITFTMIVVLLILTTTLSMAAEEKKDTEVIRGHVYCVLPTAEGVRLEPGVCPGGEGHGAHVVKTPDGQLILLQETPALADLPKLTAEQKKDVTLEGRRIGRTTFSPENLRWPASKER